MRKRMCTCASEANESRRIRRPTPTAGFLHVIGQVFSPRGFTSRGVILAWERYKPLHFTSVRTLVIYQRSRVIKLTPRQPLKATRIIIATWMLTLNRRNSLREALHCVYVSLVCAITLLNNFFHNCHSNALVLQNSPGLTDVGFVTIKQAWYVIGPRQVQYSFCH